MSGTDPAERVPAACLSPGTLILDPEQAATRAPLVEVDHVGAPDTDGMVVISGRRDDGAGCRIRIAADWPVELWTTEVAARWADTLAAERVARIQAAQQPHTRAFYAQAGDNALRARLTDIECDLVDGPQSAAGRAGLVWRRGLVLDELTTRDRVRLLARLMTALETGDTAELTRLANETTPADRDAIRAAALRELSDRAVADYDAGWFA